MKISINDLNKAYAMIIKIIEENYGDDLEIDSDFYWTVPFPNRLDLQTKPDLGVRS